MATRDDRGSALLLVPAGLLILFVLAAISVDFAAVALAERELAGAVAAAANDAATAALDDRSFYERNELDVDETRARDVASAALTARAPRGMEAVTTRVTVAGAQVCVTATARVRYLFAPAIPGARRSTTISARSTATAADRADVAQRSIC